MDATTQTLQKSSTQDAIVKKVFIRLMPFLFIGYILAYIDRINVGFAALKMNADIGLTPSMFGFGAGIFFLSYFLVEVPSNLVLQKVGARRWISRIMITWGLISAATAFVTGPTSFYTVRFFLGAAEAGFFPGVILYMTYWFPEEYRARIFGTFTVAIPAALAIGAPLSTAIMQLDGLLGLKGWQWLFILEGLPTCLFGFVFLMMVPDRPRDAAWLTPAERTELQGIIDAEDRKVAAKHGTNVLRAFSDPRLIALTFIYFANTGANLGLAFFLPQMLKSTGLSDVQTGLMTAVPYIVGMTGGIVFGHISDKKGDRRWTLFAALALSSVGLIVSGLLTGSLTAVIFMAIAAFGIYGAKAPFWALPSKFLSGAAAAGGIALINCIGNLGGFVAPSIVGWVREATGSFEAGLYFLGGMTLVAGIVTLVMVNARFTDARGSAVTSPVALGKRGS